MKPAIRVENLSKQYRIGTRKRGASNNLTETLVDGAAAVWRGLTGRGRGGDGADTFWALKDVSFEVRPGEVVGIIGRNGAGKSTLLKVLSRITEPTSGRAVVRGRMASLLEVGTGFHPELTGRENIYLNGSILGMSRGEIDRKFDEIVAFAEIEQFLDTPVKRYSSGMYVRLAFAVAAHLEPEILVVDEVLSVGDAQFQKKCLGKMDQIGDSGRTVLFVSHNMPTIKAHCTKAVSLRSGRVVEIGSVEAVVGQYMAEGLDPTMRGFNRTRRVAESKECAIVDAWLSQDDKMLEEVEWGRPFEINLEIVVSSRVRLSPEYLIRDGDQIPILFAPTGLFQGFQQTLQPGRYRITSRCPGLQLASGTYFIDLMLAESGRRFFDSYECGLCFTVDDLPRPPHGWSFNQKRGQGCLPLAVETTIIKDA
jgi:lipopolysaccharide transport system ATP-binding protein